MEFRYSYWRSGFAALLSFIFIVLSIYGLIDPTLVEKESEFMFVFVLITFTPILLISIGTIFTAKKQKLRDKLDSMTLKEQRAYKLKKIIENENN